MYIYTLACVCVCVCVYVCVRCVGGGFIVLLCGGQCIYFFYILVKFL